MKRTALSIIFFIGICCLFLFAGCAGNASVTSVSIKNNEDAIGVEMGQFNYGDYTVVVKYSDNTTEEVPLTEEMVPVYERLKFYRVGKQVVKVTYKNRSCEMLINVVRASLDKRIELKDKTAVYTGQPVALEVEGDVPTDVTVRYPNGNSYTDAGTYTVTAVCFGDNYESVELSATLTIEKASYDVSSIEFNDETFVYDGNPKSIALTGLPDGVSVKYKIGEREGNSATNAGTYRVVASFLSDNPNYNSIDDISATLTINKAEYADFDLDFKDKNAVYSGHSHAIEADLTQVPNGVATYYSIRKIKNAKGAEVTCEEEANKNYATDAGTYIVRVYFVVADTLNYENIAPKSATLFIDRAEYVIDDAFMDGKYYVYDGEPKSIALTGKNVGGEPVLPAGVGVAYTHRLVKDGLGNEVDGAVCEGNAVTNAGTYEITANLTSANENYKEINGITGVLEIALAEREDIFATMQDVTVKFDGASHSITVSYSNLPATVIVKYVIKMTKTKNGEDIETPVETEGNSAIEAGTYEITVTFVDSDKNYVEIPSLTAVLTITEA